MASYTLYILACLIFALLILGGQGVSAWRQHRAAHRQLKSFMPTQPFEGTAPGGEGV